MGGSCLAICFVAGAAVRTKMAGNTYIHVSKESEAAAATKVLQNNVVCQEKSLYSTLSALILGVQGH